MNLESIVEENKMKYEKVLVTSDYHIPYMDIKAYSIMKQYAKDYKPNHFVINGDFVDFYNLSVFEKNPERKSSLKSELETAKNILEDLRKTLGNKCKIYFVEGNHENRLQRFLWSNPEVAELDELKLNNLLDFDKYKINYIPVDRDYWSKDTGHLILGNTLITHGDNRLNGASTSKYSGYSVKNTILGATQMNTIMGHIHRLSHFYHSTPYGNLQGLEAGMLCEYTGTANWQQGFITFELIGKRNQKKGINYQTHFIDKGILYNGSKIYKVK